MKTLQKVGLIASGVSLVLLLAFIIVVGMLSGSYGENLWPAVAAAMSFGLVAVSAVALFSGRHKLALVLMGLGLFGFALVPAILFSVR